MVNKVILIGRLGADPEVRFTQDGTMVANLRLATNEYRKDKNGERVERTEWHRVVTFGRLAEVCQSYLAKGEAGLYRRAAADQVVGRQGGDQTLDDGDRRRNLADARRERAGKGTGFLGRLGSPPRVRPDTRRRPLLRGRGTATFSRRFSRSSASQRPRPYRARTS